MSVAFTKEGDFEATAADLPDRPISPHPNLVTPEGLAQLDAALAAARAAHAEAKAAGDVQADRTALARATRDLRYYVARRASAQLVAPAVGSDKVVFGATVTFEREDGCVQCYRIVGEDGADPAEGSVSYVSPARAGAARQGCRRHCHGRRAGGRDHSGRLGALLRVRASRSRWMLEQLPEQLFRPLHLKLTGLSPPIFTIPRLTVAAGRAADLQSRRRDMQ